MEREHNQDNSNRNRKILGGVIAAGALLVGSTVIGYISGRPEENMAPTTTTSEAPPIDTTNLVTTTLAETTTTAQPTTTTEAPLETETIETGSQSLTIVRWGDNVSPMAWNPVTDEVLYNSRDEKKRFDGWAANPDGSNRRCITCNIPELAAENKANTHIGIGDVSPDGKFVLLNVQRANSIVNNELLHSLAEPGRGTDNDIWIMAADGSWAQKLTDVEKEKKLGIMWPRFSEDGKSIVWAVLNKAADSSDAPGMRQFGYWTLMTADIDFSGKRPQLTNIQSYPEAYKAGDENGGLIEPYSYNKHRILYASDRLMDHSLAPQIWAFDPTTRQEPVLLTSMGESKKFMDWREFALPVNGGEQIIYASALNAENLGMDYWIMDADGSNNRRLTHMELGWHTQNEGLAIASGWALDPKGRNRIFAGLIKDWGAYQIDAVMITLDTPEKDARGQRKGLRGEYYDKLGNIVLGRTENPFAGFNFADPPAPAIGLDFSASWRGNIQVDKDGKYTYCAEVDDGVRLSIKDQSVIDSWNGFPRNVCGDIELKAGSYPIDIQYHNNKGDGFMKNGHIQLTQKAPGETEDKVVPSKNLSPA